jgi:hypothetical protein
MFCWLEHSPMSLNFRWVYTQLWASVCIKSNNMPISIYTARILWCGVPYFVDYGNRLVRLYTTVSENWCFLMSTFTRTCSVFYWLGYPKISLFSETSYKFWTICFCQIEKHGALCCYCMYPVIIMRLWDMSQPAGHGISLTLVHKPAPVASQIIWIKIRAVCLFPMNWECHILLTRGHRAKLSILGERPLKLTTMKAKTSAEGRKATVPSKMKLGRARSVTPALSGRSHDSWIAWR